MSRKNKHELSSNHVMLPGMETKPAIKPELKVALGETALKETKPAKSKSKELFRTRTIIDPNASEQAQDQGHAWITVREPIEEPARKRKSNRPIENKFTDIGSDLRPDLRPYDASTDSYEARSLQKEISEGQQAAREVVQQIHEQNITKNMPEAVSGFLIDASRKHGK